MLDCFEYNNYLSDKFGYAGVSPINYKIYSK